MRIAIFDCGAGNLHSLTRALRLEGATLRLEADPARLPDSDLIVLPGVGAFAPAAARLAPARERVAAALREGHPALGVCLGMQLLYESSEEGPGQGIGVLPGRVRRLDAPRVPHMGWNRLQWQPGWSGPRDAYFAHGFAAAADGPHVVAHTAHAGACFAAAVRSGRTLGVQFHPEKSGAPAVEWLRGVARGLLAGQELPCG